MKPARRRPTPQEIWARRVARAVRPPPDPPARAKAGLLAVLVLMLLGLVVTWWAR